MNVNQAVDEVRRTQCRKASKEDRTLIKGQRYLRRAAVRWRIFHGGNGGG
jgi:hypothetical protein